jgi:CubicO group peptidase (beta-lactamase class C family)
MAKDGGGKMVEDTYPGANWERMTPSDAGMDAEKLAQAGKWLEDQADGEGYRAVVVRGGRVVAEWNQGIARDAQLNMASATKSLFSCMLGIAIAEGKIRSADDKLIDYYPEFMDVSEGKGPKPGRHAKPEDRDITFRQLISNTSGYMKPGETPGQQFHYQTFGMNVLCHGISSAYGLYDSSDPDRLPGIGQLIQDKIRDPIGGVWGYRYTDFEHSPGAVTHIFGHSPRCDASALDMARMGLLWSRGGRWKEVQVVPKEWLREATHTAPDIRAHCPREQWQYGYAFWTNDYGQLWPSLPQDSFAASGAGRKHIWVCPSLDLVVAQSPGLYQDQAENDAGLLRLVADACALP